MYINIEVGPLFGVAPRQLWLWHRTAPASRATPNGLTIEALLAWVTKEPEQFSTYQGKTAF